MSILTTIWRHITNSSSNTQKKYRVAFFTSQPSKTMSHYVDRLGVYLEVLAPHSMTIVTYENIQDHAVAQRFLAEHAGCAYDSLLALDSQAAHALVRLKNRLGLQVPAIVVGYKEMLPHQLPRDVVAICSPDLSSSYFELFQRLYPQGTRYLVVASRDWIEKTAQAQSLFARSKQAGVEVDKIYLGAGEHPVDEQFGQHAPGATFAYLAFDSLVFKDTQSVVQLCHQYGMLAIASNIHAIHYGTDLIFGYPETKVFRYIAGRLFALMHGSSVISDSLNMNLQLHCNTQNLGNEHKYILDTVGSLLLDSDVSVHLHTNNKAQR